MFTSELSMRLVCMRGSFWVCEGNRQSSEHEVNTLAIVMAYHISLTFTIHIFTILYIKSKYYMKARQRRLNWHIGFLSNKAE